MRVRRRSLGMARSSTPSAPVVEHGHHVRPVPSATGQTGDGDRRPAARRRGVETCPDGNRGRATGAVKADGWQGHAGNGLRTGRRRHALCWWGLVVVLGVGRSEHRHHGRTGTAGFGRAWRHLDGAGGYGMGARRDHLRDNATGRRGLGTALAVMHTHTPKGGRFCLPDTVLILARATVPKPFPIPLVKPYAEWLPEPFLQPFPDCIVWVRDTCGRSTWAALHPGIEGSEPLTVLRRTTPEHLIGGSLERAARHLFRPYVLPATHDVRVGGGLCSERVGSHTTPAPPSNSTAPSATSRDGGMYPSSDHRFRARWCRWPRQDAGQQRRLWSGQR